VVWRGRLVPGVPGRAGPKGRSTRLTMPLWRAPRWTITAQRARTHPQSRADRWRNVAEWSAAVTAELPFGVGRPQPMAASRALRIDALNGPSRQILHAFSPSEITRYFSVPDPKDSLERKRTEKVAGILRPWPCGVKRKDTIASGGVAEQFPKARRLLRLASEFSWESCSPFTTFRCLPTICASEAGKD
jgi:hypothetical protein